MKFPEVKVHNSAEGYVLKVAVYRHITSPKEITVNIESIHPLPPVEPKEPRNPVCKLVKPGEDIAIEALKRVELNRQPGNLLIFTLLPGETEE